MNHSEFKNLILLDSYGELDDAQSETLQRHLKDCAECRVEAAEFKKFQLFLDQNEEDVAEDLLWQARQSLFEKLRAQNAEGTRKNDRSWFRIFSDFLSVLRPVPIMAGLMLLALGFLVGNWSSGVRPSPVGMGQIAENPFEANDLRISRVRFAETETTDGDVELSFLASKEFHIKGSVEDNRIQRLLAFALLNESNPGVRLRAVSRLQNQPGKADQEITEALIAALKTDGNPAVRQQALTALTEYPFTGDTKQALLYVLRFDDNARMRIEAINALSVAVEEGQTLEEDSLGILQERMEEENNNLVRSRTRDVLRLAGYDKY